jgi:Leucine-rich repeat (LRR) protein
MWDLFMNFSSTLLVDIQQRTFREEFLDLSGQELGDEEALLLAEALKHNTHVKKIKLWGNNIGDRGAAAIALVSTLEEVNLADNKITAIGCLALSNSFFIKKLNISGNAIGDKGIIFFSNNASLLELEAASCDISAIGANDVFEKNKTLKKIDFSSNPLGHEGVKLLKFNNTLVEVALAYTAIGDEGAAHIANNRSLKTADLSNNGITDSGATALANESNLEVLNLTQNEVGDASSKAFSKNNQLKELILISNKITAEGLSCLLSSTSLNVIELYGNPIYLTSFKKIKDSHFATSDNTSFIRTTKPIKVTDPSKALESPPSILEATPIPAPSITHQFNRPKENDHRALQEGQSKAEALMLHPDFVEFFQTASFTQLKYFFEQLKKDCLQVQSQRKRQKLDQ